MSNIYFLSKEELTNIIKDRFHPIDCNRILSAYDMADQSYGDKKTLSGAPYFFHTTRVARILLTEIDVNDSDLIIASLLHDIYKTTNDLNDEILSYNFNSYVAYLINVLKEDFEYIKKNPFRSEGLPVKIPEDDYLIIWLAEHLDNLRFSVFSPEFNPINYILNISAYLFPLSENTNNPKIKYLINELKKEKNKLLS